MKFRSGDRVICIDVDDDDTNLEFHKIYTIKHGNGDTDKHLRTFVDKLVTIREINTVYKEDRFRLLSEVRKEIINKIRKTWD